MKYFSTRDTDIRVSAANAIAKGLSADGGLYVPEVLPTLPDGALKNLCGMSYMQRAVYVMSMFLDDFTTSELTNYTNRAYSTVGFDTPDIAPVYSIDDTTHFLELWHGPTCAFKDMALQMLPYLLTSSLKKIGEDKDVCILVATSGDTGKAALEGFADVEGTKILVFYPQDGVSDIQKLQMTSQSGSNVGVCAVKGNFDDAQTGVKTIFSDELLRNELAKRGWMLSSANSINWGRLLPQIVYYISAYCDLVNSNNISIGDKINFCVPTGNFGDILAGYYAMKMGLPVNKLICASNMNDVLTDFIDTGTYDRNREFFTTISPSMDILVSSNLERLLFDISGYDDVLIREYMLKLSNEGRYTVSDDIKDAIKSVFAAEYCDDDETKNVINRTFSEKNYLIDTHTAVAYGVLEKYRNSTGDNTISVVVSTASPYKFCDSVLSAIGEHVDEHGLALIDLLEHRTGVPAPMPLKNLNKKVVRFTDSVERNQLTEKVLDFLK